MAVVDAPSAFLAGPLVGATGIRVGARATTNTDGFREAVVTALAGAVVGFTAKRS
ncbi:hypothetical protein [Halorubrum lipolyticum]|uniref:Uncharacterized protein n=1 Tax=Halorubrum lipolyticum DSM 21995 TaxID=1227482 RepID=M0P289_9EURY|nr:hypothetical protein [Halorubrum lipolyticum]EMA64267.1 hypothetical protein C469_01155 [Halorubrum lipolyticum DSM 21995]